MTPVNVRRGTAGSEIPVGTFPQAIIASADTAFVLNAEIGADFNPLRSGTITVLAGSTPQVIATIDLTGINPISGAIAPDGFLYVVNAGSFGAGNGSLSIVNRRTLVEERSELGFGDFPSAIAIAPNGRIYIGAFAFGVAVWNATTRAFERAPENAVQPGGIAASSGLGADSGGRVYSLQPECTAAGKAYRLSDNLEVEAEVRTGICPFAIGFTRLPAE